MPDTFQRITVTTGDGIGRIWLNRPDKRNALDRRLVDELHAAAGLLAGDDAVHAVLLAGRGPAFCAGADLAYLRSLSEFSLEENAQDSAALAATLRAIYTLPKPTVARVHGPAIAGGCGLATVCDVVIAAEQATFGFSEVRIGFVPAIVMSFIARKTTSMRVRELLLSGRIVGAHEAYERGLVTEVVHGDEHALDARLEQILTAMASASPTATRMTKEILTALDGMSLDAALDYTARMNAMARMSPDCQEGIERFLNKDER